MAHRKDFHRRIKNALADVMIVDSAQEVGIISDIDDTILVTWLPRAMVAAWNSWVKRTDTRKPVEGMDAFFNRLHKTFPDAPVFYLSTGAWNTYRTLNKFTRRHSFHAADAADGLGTYGDWPISQRHGA